MNPTVVKTVKIAIVLFITMIILMLPSTAFGIAGLTVIQQRMIAIFVFAALMWILEGVPAWVTSVLIIVVMLFTVSDSAIKTLINPALYPEDQVETKDTSKDIKCDFSSSIPEGWTTSIKKENLKFDKEKGLAFTEQDTLFFTLDETDRVITKIDVVAWNDSVDQKPIVAYCAPRGAQPKNIGEDGVWDNEILARRDAGVSKKEGEKDQIVVTLNGKQEAFYVHDVVVTTAELKPASKLKGLIPYKDIIAAFADPTVMLFMGGFILALVASKSGVDVTLARVMLKPFGRKSKVVLLGFMFVTAIFSMFISNTATAAMMLTFLAPVFRTLPEDEKGRIGLALAIPIGCNIGGIGTPIGTPPNGIALGALKDAGINIGFLDWMIMMVPLMVVILLIAWVVLLKMYKFKSETVDFKIEGGAKKCWQTNAIYIVMALTIALWCGEKVFGINSYVVALFPVGAFTALGIVTAKDIQQIDWSVLWMVAGGFALGTGMKGSGLAKAMVSSIPFDTFPVFLVLIGAGLICWLLSTFISNSASAALMVPILITVGTGMSEQLAPIGGVTTLVVGLALCASFAMALPISTPPNAIAYSTGLVQTNQMAKVGLIVGVISICLAYGLLILLGTSGFMSSF